MLIREEQRKKKWAPKVRSGCLVCRARRVKCDEAKPTCKRCVTGKRACRYESLSLGCRGEAATPTCILPRPATAHNVSPFADVPRPHELELFAAFKDHVVPLMSDFLDRDFWEVSMLQGIRAYPAAWYSSLAISAMYQKLELRRLGYDDSDGKSSLQMQHYENTALMYCSKAARLLVEADHEETSTTQREMLLISCILLICYAGLRRDFAQTVTHMYNGVYLSKKWDYWQLKPGRDRSYRLPNCVIPVSSIGQLFRRLEMQLITSPLTLPAFLTTPIQPVRIDIDVPYQSAAEAYAELLPIASAHRYMFHQANRSCKDGLPVLTAEYASIRENFLLWSDKFNAYKKSFSKGGSDSDEADRLMALTLWEMGARITTFADISNGAKMFDGYQDEICQSLCIVEYFLEESQFGEAYTSASWLPSLSSFMSLMGQPLRFISTKCRVPTIRRRCLLLLKKYPFIDGTLDSTYVAGFAQARMELEENGWHRAPIPGGCECVADVYVCADHRIPASAIESHKNGRRVTLQSAYEIANGLPGSTITMP